MTLNDPQRVYLCFPDHAAALAVMAQIPEAFYLDAQGQPHAREASPLGAIDVVGTVRQGGEWDAQGNEVVPPTELPGWHVNVLLHPGFELPAPAAPYAVPEPATPYRVFG